MPRTHSLLFVPILALLAVATASRPLMAATTPQVPPPLERVEDPYTRGEPKLLAKAGYASLGPFLLTPSLRSDKIDEVVGIDRMMWIETDHFAIGCALEEVDFPKDREAKDRTEQDLAQLRRKLRTIPAKPKKLDRWLRAHLYAHRLEALYADFAERTGYDPDRTDLHLGSPKKFVVLLFGKQSNMVRFFRRFTDYTGEDPVRWYLKDNSQMILVAAEDAFDGFLSRDETMHCFVVHNAVHNMIDACHDYSYDMPLWFEEGLAHWYVRQVDERYNSVSADKEMGIDYATAWEWPRRVRARMVHDFFPKHDEMLPWGYGQKMTYTDHMFAFSRVDFLIQKKKGGIGDYIRGLHGLPIGETGVSHDAVVARQAEVLESVFGLDGPKFDAEWKAWVLRTYPKK